MKRTAWLVSASTVMLLLFAACGQPVNGNANLQIDPTLNGTAEALETTQDNDGCIPILGPDGKPVINPLTGQRQMTGCESADMCEAAVQDANTVIAWGAAYEAGAMLIQDLRANLADMKQEWTVRDVRGIRNQMIKLLEETEWRTVHSVPGGSDYQSGDGPYGLMIIDPRDWTTGDIALSYESTCREPFPN